MRDPATRIAISRTSGGERWQLRWQSRPLGIATLALAAAFALLAAAASASAAPTAAERATFTTLALVCAALAVVTVLLGMNLLRSGLRLDGDGLTCQGAVLRRRLRWADLTGFSAGIEELIPNRPAAIVLAKLRDGRYVALPGTRVEGVRWNLDDHRRVTAYIAAALEERRPGRAAPPAGC